MDNQRSIKTLLLLGLLLTLWPLFVGWTQTQEVPAAVNEEKLAVHRIDKVLVLSIDSSINPATHEYLKSAMEELAGTGAQAVLIKMNTPGGLLSTTKDILQLFGKASVPLIIWVAPEGASATSAGALLASAAHFLFMAKGTNIGAATPVTISGDSPKLPIKREKERVPKDGEVPPAERPEGEEGLEGTSSSAMDRKIINDLVALVESLSTARGRNGESFASMITEASSFSAEKARTLNIINGIASSEQDIWKLIHGKDISIQGVPKRVSCPTHPHLIERGMDAGQWLLNVFANPSLAYILFLAGLLLLYLEMQAPGGFVAGGLGAICLLLAAISFQVLPVNFGSLGLIILAFALFILESYVTSFGLLNLTGLMALLFGSLFLFRTKDSYLHLGHDLIYGTVLAVAIFLAVMFFYILKDERRRRAHQGQVGTNSTLPGGGLQGVILRRVTDRPLSSFPSPIAGGPFHGHFYQIKLAGEIWNAFAEDAEPYAEGAAVQVVETYPQSLIVKIKKLNI